jgi:putative ABC transport system substrate-binding protein
VSTESDFNTALEALTQLGVRALVIATDAFFTSRSKQIAELAVRHAMPTVYQNRAFTVAGGLVAYGADIADAIRRAGIYTGRMVAIPRQMFQEILRLIAGLRPQPPPAPA